jgi:hypothetical protein
MSTPPSDVTPESLIEEIRRLRHETKDAAAPAPHARQRLQLALAVDLLLLSEVPLSEAADIAGIDPHELVLALHHRGISVDRYLGKTPPGVGADPRLKTLKLSVIMPCYNEKQTLMAFWSASAPSRSPKRSSSWTTARKTARGTSSAARSRGGTTT